VQSCFLGAVGLVHYPILLHQTPDFARKNDCPMVDFCRVQNGAKDFGGCTKPCAHTLISAWCKMVQIGAVGAQPLASGRQQGDCI
jgi:hypothetical protein